MPARPGDTRSALALAPATTAWHALPGDECARVLGSGAAGLAPAEAGRRLARYGPNVFAVSRGYSAWRLLWDQLRSVFVLLLLAGAGISLAAGDRLDALVIGLVIVLNVTIGFVTELRARQAIHSLLALDVERARVVRAGTLGDVPAAELVPGDVIELEAGQRVPADARLLDAAELRTAEAALTGESEPVDKAADAVVGADVVLAERATMVYKTTGVTAGRGRAVVVATGMATEVGRIGALAAAVRDPRTPLERRLEVLGRKLALAALAVAAAVPLTWLARRLPVAEVAQTAIALAVAAVPEGLPVVAIVALAIGVRRLSRRRALIRHLPAVETLGSATVICTDKTGTLTAGAMTVTTYWLPGGEVAVTGAGYGPEGGFLSGTDQLRPRDHAALDAALRTGLLACRADAVQVGDRWDAVGDPTDAALVVAARKAGLERDALLMAAPLAGEIPFAGSRMLTASFHREDGRLVAHVKGAPDRVLAYCTTVRDAGGLVPLDARRRADILARNEELAGRGLRVLALARGTGATGTAADSLSELELLGLAGMMDPPAAGVRGTIERIHQAGIRIVMLTGDQRLTAAAVARQLGLAADTGEALDGREIEMLDDEDLARRMATVAAVSRISPEAKLRVVEALQRRGEIVAMLGDGINDAAALRQADIGVAMGGRGADLAKEAADVILLDDRFETIGAAIEEGRVVFDNIRHFVYYLFSCNLAEVLLFLGAGAARLEAPLLPLQILWLNLVTDTFPALALAVEPAAPDVMRRPPRQPMAPLLPGPLTRRALVDAGLIAVLALIAFAIGLRRDAPLLATTLAFNTLAFAQVFHLGNARSREPVLAWRRILANPAALGAVVLVIGLQVLATMWPPLSNMLRLAPLAPSDWALVVGLGSLAGLIGQVQRLGSRVRRGLVTGGLGTGGLGD